MTDRMTDEERALLHKAAEAYEDEQRKYQSYEQQLLDRISELEELNERRLIDVRLKDKRISELEAQLKAKCDHSELLAEIKEQDAFINKQNRQIKHREKIWKARAAELQRKYDALVDGITFAQSHTSETLHLLQWDQLGWDVPEEVIESLVKADSKLRALLEEVKDE